MSLKIKRPNTLVNNAYWNKDSGEEGVAFSNLTYRYFRGTNEKSSRPVVRYEYPDEVPCYEITLEDIYLWTEDGDAVTWSCSSAYGDGGCLADDDGDDEKRTSYEATVVTSTSVLEASYAISTMDNDHESLFPSDKSFTVPAVPTTFFPGLKPKSALLALTTHAKREAGMSGPVATGV